jgi:hypothetical protein
MSERSGIIYMTDKGDYGLAIHKEQYPEIQQHNKVFVHLFEDSLCTRPKFAENGKELATLKDFKKLTRIGFSD